MNIADNLNKLNARLYRDGTGVIFFDHKSVSERKKPTQKAERHFKIKGSQVRSACIAAWLNKQSKNMLFITFTFPFDPSEDEAQQIWKLTLDSLRNTYKVNNYVWVKERQESGRLHYHILIDRNRVGIKNLQNTYNHHIINVNAFSMVSNNSVRLGTRPVITSIKSVSYYLSKYITKGNSESTFKKRAWGCSSGYRLYRNVDLDELFKQIHYIDSGNFKIIWTHPVVIIDETDYYLIFKFRDYIDVSP